MRILLKSLPRDCYVNIVGFGSDYKTLFPRSKQYNPTIAARCIEYIDTMDADFGGTEVLKALRRVYSKARVWWYHRQIILITDGAVSNSEAVIKFVRKRSSTVRLFALGIGTGASTELV